MRFGHTHLMWCYSNNLNESFHYDVMFTMCVGETAGLITALAEFPSKSVSCVHANYYSTVRVDTISGPSGSECAVVASSWASLLN